MAEEFILNISENKLVTEDLIDKIFERTGISYANLKVMLRYNINTPRQIAVMTGKHVATVNNLLNPAVIDDKIVYRLKKVYPFRVEDDLGPIFILFDEACLDYIKKSL